MSRLVKLLIAFGIFVYVVSPVDLVPGPIDDVILILLGIAGTKGRKLVSSDED